MEIGFFWTAPPPTSSPTSSLVFSLLPPLLSPLFSSPLLLTLWGHVDMLVSLYPLATRHWCWWGENNLIDCRVGKKNPQKIRGSSSASKWCLKGRLSVLLKQRLAWLKLHVFIHTVCVFYMADNPEAKKKRPGTPFCIDSFLPVSPAGDPSSTCNPSSALTLCIYCRYVGHLVVMAYIVHLLCVHRATGV